MNPAQSNTWSHEVYKELHEMAAALMSGEREGHTLAATALTHEVWLRLLRSHNADSLDHGAFLGLAAQAMRRILIDHARRRASAKRGGEAQRTTLSNKLVSKPPEAFIMELDSALEALQHADPELARLVELRFYGDASVEEIAVLLGLSARSVKRRWRFARAWLQHYIKENES